MATSRISNLAKASDITISESGECTMEDADLLRFKGRNHPILKQAINSIFEHFPIDADHAAHSFGRLYFTRENLCRVVSYSNRVPVHQLSIVRNRFLKSGKLNDEQAKKYGIVARMMKLKISTRNINPAELPYYHANVKDLKIVIGEIKRSLLPSAMFSLPFATRRVREIYADTSKTPNYTPHVKFNGRKNPLVTKKFRNTVISQHILPAFAWVNIAFQLITTLHENYTKWSLWHDNRDLAFHFGGIIYMDIYVSKWNPVRKRPETEKYSLAITCNASRHINGFIQTLARVAIGRIRESYNAAILTKKLYALEQYFSPAKKK